MRAAKTLAKNVAAQVHEKLGFDVELFDVRKLSGICDYFLLCSAKNRYHLDALKDAALEAMERADAAAPGVEGDSNSGWIVLDAGSLIVHLFLSETREYYGLHRLWGDAGTVELDLEKPAASLKTRKGRTAEHAPRRKH
ncbi:MAG: ribosome silencing factor [bacterium]